VVGFVEQVENSEKIMWIFLLEFGKKRILSKMNSPVKNANRMHFQFFFQ
jgi:hypothetical protein